VVPNPDVRPREDPARPYAQGAAGQRRRSPRHRPRHARLLRRRSANLVNEARCWPPAWQARRRDGEFEHAKDKVMMGAERRSLVMSDEEKKLTAYHEAGHALCAMHEPECDPVHKATIIPRGRALGMVMSLPEGDRYSKSKSKLLAELTHGDGRPRAEEIIFGADKVSNGAAGDIKMATDQARRMITEWGMSDKLGMIAYGDNSQEVFLGHSVTQNKNVSEATAREIDARSRRSSTRLRTRRARMLTENVEELHRLARGLLEYETLSATKSAPCCAASR
jgi:cell division protease FtsH